MTDILHHSHATVAHHVHTIPLNSADRVDAEICQASYELSDPHYANSTDAYHHYVDTHPESTDLHRLRVLASSKDSIFLQNVDHPEQCTMGIRGTQLHHSIGTLARDTLNDIQIASGESPHRDQTAYHDFYQMRHEHPECTTWHFTGHSLGGRIANDLAALEPQTTSTSFEAPGTPNTHYHNITSHKIVSDALAFGSPSTADVYHENPSNSYSSHSIFNY